MTPPRRTAFASCLLAGLVAGCWKTTVEPVLVQSVGVTTTFDRSAMCSPRAKPARVGETVQLDYRIVSTHELCRCRDVSQAVFGLGDAYCGSTIELPDDDEEGHETCEDAGTTPGNVTWATVLVYPTDCRAAATIDPADRGLLHTTIACDHPGTASLAVRGITSDGNIWQEMTFDFTADGRCPSVDVDGGAH